MKIDASPYKHQTYTQYQVCLMYRYTGAQAHSHTITHM